MTKSIRNISTELLNWKNAFPNKSIDQQVSFINEVTPSQASYLKNSEFQS